MDNVDAMAPRRLADYDEVRNAELKRMIGNLLTKRMWLTPIGVIAVLLFNRTELTTWRPIAIVFWFSAFATMAIWTTLRMRRGGTVAPLVVSVNALAMSIGVLGVSVFTGGIESPLIPQLFFIISLVPLLVGGRLAILVVVLQGVCIATLTVVQATGLWTSAMPDLFGGGAHPGPATLTWFRGAMMLLITPVWGAVSLGIRRANDAAAATIARARDEALATHAEQTRTLTTLAGEIAHELKNPLATVKGLAGLIAPRLDPTRDAEQVEHMAVLRREVDRMQEILAEFLNFSRPLVPLSVEDVELGALAADVVGLHGAVAAARGVELTVELPSDRAPVSARCDRRKVNQILINLVQNAIDATPPGGRVRVVVDRTTEEAQLAARVRVIDDGTGVAPEVAGRLFEAGVTTKAKGSGLGLAMSRALARQHGGDLTLRGRGDAPGCTAELILPVEPVVS